MATQEPERATEAPALTSLPSIEDLPVAKQGYDQASVREAFDAFRRHVLQLQSQLRVLQTAGETASAPVPGQAVRMDALSLIRAAAEFADQIERDAQQASVAQLARTEEQVRRAHEELEARERDVERYRQESERRRAEILNAARAEADELLAKSSSDAARELREAEARGTRLLEQSRHQATELTNATRAEVEQTLEWARAQASAVIARAQQGAEQLLSVVGLKGEELSRVVDAIVRSADAAAGPGPLAGSSESSVAPASPPQEHSAVAAETPDETADSNGEPRGER